MTVGKTVNRDPVRETECGASTGGMDQQDSETCQGGITPTGGVGPEPTTLWNGKWDG